jgi:hypothetical protein
VYVVVHIRVATDITTTLSRGRGRSIQSDFVGLAEGHRSEDVTEDDGNVLHSYSVREYILTRDGPALYSVRVNGG